MQESYCCVAENLESNSFPGLRSFSERSGVPRSRCQVCLASTSPITVGCRSWTMRCHYSRTRAHASNMRQRQTRLFLKDIGFLETDFETKESDGKVQSVLLETRGRRNS